MNKQPRRYRARRRELRIEQDSDAVFDEAIRAGLLSEDPQDERFAGHYMYMHHDAEGTPWFKHRETRAYVTLRGEAVEAVEAVEAAAATGAGAGASKRNAGAWMALWAASSMAIGFVGGVLADFSRGPTVGTVRLNELTVEFVAEAVRIEGTAQDTARAARTWAAELQGALETVAVRHGVVLLPVEAVAAGARDYTADIRAEMHRVAPARAANGTTAHGNTAYGGTGPEEAAPGGYSSGQPELRP